MSFCSGHNMLCNLFCPFWPQKRLSSHVISITYATCISTIRYQIIRLAWPDPFSRSHPFSPVLDLATIFSSAMFGASNHFTARWKPFGLRCHIKELEGRIDRATIKNIGEGCIGGLNCPPKQHTYKFLFQECWMARCWKMSIQQPPLHNRGYPWQGR